MRRLIILLAAVTIAAFAMTPASAQEPGPVCDYLGIGQDTNGDGQLTPADCVDIIDVDPTEIVREPCVGPEGQVLVPTVDVNGDGQLNFDDCNEDDGVVGPRPTPPDTSRGGGDRPPPPVATTALAATGLNLTVGSVLVGLLLIVGGFMLVAARRRGATE